jgi:uncharacterized protein (DUF849 family)
VLLGNIGTASTSPADVAAILSHLPPETVWSAAGIGREQLRGNLLGLQFGQGVRIGLEDNLFFDAEKTPATNPQLVERLVRIAHDLELSPATPLEVRAAIGL